MYFIQTKSSKAEDVTVLRERERVTVKESGGRERVGEVEGEEEREWTQVHQTHHTHLIPI